MLNCFPRRVLSRRPFPVAGDAGRTAVNRALPVRGRELRPVRAFAQALAAPLHLITRVAQLLDSGVRRHHAGDLLTDVRAGREVHQVRA